MQPVSSYGANYTSLGSEGLWEDSLLGFRCAALRSTSKGKMSRFLTFFQGEVSGRTEGLDQTGLAAWSKLRLEILVSTSALKDVIFQKNYVSISKYRISQQRDLEHLLESELKLIELLT